LRRIRLSRLLLAAFLIISAVLPAVAARQPRSTCQLGTSAGGVQHVIYLQFDNVHFARDNPNVPSDLEQMPHLLNFLTSNGALLSQLHTPLIAHTGGDIVSLETGLYPDRHGLAVSNTYRYFTPAGPARTAVAFTYWTDPVFDPGAPTPSDTSYNLVGADGRNVPAPWVPFTRAGCDVGAAGIANAVLENTATDIPTVFGAGSPQAQAVATQADQAFADYVGIAVHCAQGSSVCASGHEDRLPQEPGGYDSFQALFGHKEVAPVISPSAALADLNGQAIQDSGGRQGFPGFDGLTPGVTLSYIAAMQERGIPITFGYISDAHDPHNAPSGTPAYGPGQAEYTAVLRQYDAAFDAFFNRLARDGIDATNTLFVVAVDEGDHFVGGPPAPSGCDGMNVGCTYAQIGEIAVNLTGLLATQAGVSTSFSVHADAAPAIYLDGQPARDDASVHQFARALASLRVDNPYTGANEPVVQFLAGEAEMRVLHMVTGDRLRTPTLVLFQDPSYYGMTGPSDCERACVALTPANAWNHGDVGSDINTTWLGLAGPGVRRAGVDAQTWADHADVRPTLLALLGLKDSYTSDGRALFEVLQDGVLSPDVADQRAMLIGLGRDLKRINAPVGDLGMSTLSLATQALASPDDAQLAAIDAELDGLAARRASLAASMEAALEGAAFAGRRLDPQQVASMHDDAQGLLRAVQALLPDK
jgi:hypothetical protein